MLRESTPCAGGLSPPTGMRGASLQLSGAMVPYLSYLGGGSEITSSTPLVLQKKHKCSAFPTLLQFSHKPLLLGAFQAGPDPPELLQARAETALRPRLHPGSHSENSGLSGKYILFLSSLICPVHRLLLAPYLCPTYKILFTSIPFRQTF